MTRKTNDLVVTTGSYIDAQGQTKSRFENVGGVFRTDDGKVFCMIKRTFNPAGVPFREGSDTIILGVMALRENASGNAQRATPQPTQTPLAQPTPTQPPTIPQIPDDDIPF